MPTMFIVSIGRLRLCGAIYYHVDKDCLVLNKKWLLQLLLLPNEVNTEISCAIESYPSPNIRHSTQFRVTIWPDKSGLRPDIIQSRIFVLCHTMQMWNKFSHL